MTGQVGIAGHLTVADRTVAAAQAGIAGSIRKPGQTIMGYPAFDAKVCSRAYIVFKHLPEMAAATGLESPPAFCPVVADFPCGMEVTVPLFARDLRGTRADVADALRAAYPTDSGLVRFADAPDEGGFLAASAFAGRDDMQVAVFGNDERILLVSRFDNLGKGASGAAIQNLNLLLGADERTGLVC